MRKLWAELRDSPDVIVVSLPPPSLGAAAAEWASRNGAKLVVDVQDLWPETFARFWPQPLRWANRLVFAPVARDARRAYRRADFLTGVARGYVERARPGLRPGTPDAVLPLGVDLRAFDAAVHPLSEFGLNKPPGRRWIFFGGAIRSHIDAGGTVAMMAELARRGREEIRLIVVADDETTAPLREPAERLGLSNIEFMGYRPYPQFVSLAVASDVALCPIRPESLVFLPNRVFDCLAAGLPIINTLSGELADLLAAHDAGRTCPPDQPARWADAAEELLGNRGAPPPASRPDWVKQLDKPGIVARLADGIERIAGQGPHERPEPAA
jgi:glycosyltransferase involved in cell wall biosynthesis